MNPEAEPLDDITIVCRECGQGFVFAGAEREHFGDHGFADRKH
jgi:hypothetical protein